MSHVITRKAPKNIPKRSIGKSCQICGISTFCCSIGNLHPVITYVDCESRSGQSRSWRRAPLKIRVLILRFKYTRGTCRDCLMKSNGMEFRRRRCVPSSPPCLLLVAPSMHHNATSETAKAVCLSGWVDRCTGDGWSEKNCPCPGGEICVNIYCMSFRLQ